ncbi:hypothetical protein XELAEV_18041487mg [Xenopus laevis]|uniref:Uncharacterized protein n=1 Tax=Xenopus laevis TaxID=8355 RepID=A0A974C292_XENLA|nr:hypothetical protein XELAEV_18041487mg [Xenopus laevis]
MPHAIGTSNSAGGTHQPSDMPLSVVLPLFWKLLGNAEVVWSNIPPAGVSAAVDSPHLKETREHFSSRSQDPGLRVDTPVGLIRHRLRRRR